MKTAKELSIGDIVYKINNIYLNTKKLTVTDIWHIEEDDITTNVITVHFSDGFSVDVFDSDISFINDCDETFIYCFSKECALKTLDDKITQIEKSKKVCLEN